MLFHGKFDVSIVNCIPFSYKVRLVDLFIYFHPEERLSAYLEIVLEISFVT